MSTLGRVPVFGPFLVLFCQALLIVYGIIFVGLYLTWKVLKWTLIYTVAAINWTSRKLVAWDNRRYVRKCQELIETGELTLLGGRSVEAEGN